MAIKRFKVLIISLLGILLLAGIVYVIKLSGYWLSYQVSVSMPEGWYLITPVKTIKPNMIVVFKPPASIQKFLIYHHWLPDKGIMMKHVVALPGDKICKHNGLVSINGKQVARVVKTYAAGKELPNKPFCGILPPKHYLLMSTRVWNSFDGRYFGPVKKNAIIGQAVKL